MRKDIKNIFLIIYTMKFLSGLKIDLASIPTYKTFGMTWVESLDYKLLQILYSKEEIWNKPEIKALVQSSILETINKNTGVLNVNHYQKFKRDGKGYGRFYPEKYRSLSVMPRHYKHSIYSVLGWKDLDMKSAHPTIIFEAFKNQGDILLAYAEYLTSKEEKTKELLNWYNDPENPVLNEEDIKYLFNLTTFGGSHNTWIKHIEEEAWTLLNGEPDPNWKPRTVYNKQPHPFYCKYFDDTEFARNKIFKSNPELVELARESRKKKEEPFTVYDVQTTTMSLFCSIIENDILYIAYKLLVKLKVIKERCGGLEMDGLNVPRPQSGWDSLDCDDILSKLNEKVKQETKLAVKFVWKGYKEENVHLNADDIENSDTDYMEADFDGVKNDMEAAKKVFELHPHWVCCDDELYVFNTETGLWDSSPTSHRETISKYCDHLYVLSENKKGEFIPSKTKSYGNTLSLMDKIPPFMKTLCVDNNWIKTSQYTSLGKILFNNGYYDFHSGLFFSKAEYGFDPKIVFTAKIHHNFEAFSSEDMEYMEDVKQRLFYNSLGKEVGDYMLLTLARGLAGDMMKRILFGLGPTNSGKGVLTTALMLSCGDYIGSFNAENLAYRQSSNDEAQIMRWSMLLRNKRIIISNELKSTVELNGNMIKKQASGGDPLIGRNHGGKETEFITHYLPVVLANDLPNIKPYDDAVGDRVRVIGYTKNYVDNPTNDFELKKDDNIKNELKELRFQRVFVGLLIRAYLDFKQNGEPDEPAEVMKAKTDWVAQDKSVIDTFIKDFEITDNANDWVRSSDIDAWIAEKKLGITMKKFGGELTRYCKINGIQNVESKPKKIGKKTPNCWFGIKFLVETEPEYDAEV